MWARDLASGVRHTLTHPGTPAIVLCIAALFVAGGLFVSTVPVVVAWVVGAAWHGPPVWFHGDIASDNLLVSNRGLADDIDTDEERAAVNRRIIDAVLADHDHAG